MSRTTLRCVTADQTMPVELDGDPVGQLPLAVQVVLAALRVSVSYKCRFKHARLLRRLLGLLLVGACCLWLRSYRQQEALNHQLIAALVNGNDHQAITLVNEGADPNTLYTRPTAPSLRQLINDMLHRSPPLGDSKPTAFLIACGAFWHENDSDWQHGHDSPEVVQAMLQHGARVNAQNEGGWTALMWSIVHFHTETTGVLLDNGANVNMIDNNGTTALILSVGYAGNSTRVTRLLLEHGADPNPSVADDLTPLQIAQSNDRPDIVAILRKAGAKN